MADRAGSGAIREATRQLGMDLFPAEIFLDVETQRLSHEVEGGWSNIRAFRLSVAVTWDREHGFRRWFEEDAKKLVAELAGYLRIVTFNGSRFDLEVLSRYAPVEKLRQNSFDIHEKLHQQLGHRVTLDHLARETLGVGKTGTGEDAVRWWRSGEKEKVAAYCEQDVAVLRRLVEHGRAKGYVVVSARRIPVEWE